MDKGEDSIVFLNSVKGIEYLRPPTLNFLKIKDTHDFIEYKIDKNPEEHIVIYNQKYGYPK